jgi:ribosomal protein S18 acetylase RimI-like enzyme
MEMDIPAEPDEPRPPDDVTIRAFDPNRDARAFYDAYTQAWQQYEGQEWTPEGFATWSTELEGSDFDPGLWFLAEEQDRVVGIAQCFDFPRNMGWVHRLGTLPDMRGRGIGRALMLTVVRAYKERGVARIGLTVSSRNVSAARSLYEALGFRDVLRIDNYRKKLGPDER